MSSYLFNYLSSYLLSYLFKERFLKLAESLCILKNYFKVLLAICSGVSVSCTRHDVPVVEASSSTISLIYSQADCLVDDAWPRTLSKEQKVSSSRSSPRRPLWSTTSGSSRTFHCLILHIFEYSSTRFHSH